MAITFEDFETGESGTGAASLGFTSTVTGSAIVGIVRINATGRTLSITDDQSGNVWALGPQVSVGAGDVYYTFYGLNLNTSGSNAITVTAHSSNSGDFIRTCAVSYSGIASSNALDQSSSNTGSGTSWTTSSVTTTMANEVVVNLVGGPAGNAFTPDAAFTSRGSVSTDMFIEDKIVSSTGAFSPTVTVSVGGNFGAFLLTLSDTPVGGGVTVPQEVPATMAWPIDWGPRYV